MGGQIDGEAYHKMGVLSRSLAVMCAPDSLGGAGRPISHGAPPPRESGARITALLLVVVVRFWNQKTGDYPCFCGFAYSAFSNSISTELSILLKPSSISESSESGVDGSPSRLIS